MRPSHDEAAATLLQVPVTLDGLRLIDVIILPIGIAVALVVCLPILIGMTLLAAALAGMLKWLGARTKS